MTKEETTPLSAEEVLSKYVGKSYLRMWSEWQKEAVIKAMIIFAAQPLPDFVKSKDIKWIREDFVIDTIMMEWVKKLVNDGRLLIVAGSEEYFATRGIENPPNAAASQPSPQVEDRIAKPKVVCFCGSTRFSEWFMIKRWELEKQGIITLGINILPNGYFKEADHHGAEQEGVKHILDELHKRKIDLSDEVYILNVGGYIGESTRAELDYALSIGKPVEYLEPLSTLTSIK